VLKLQAVLLKQGRDFINLTEKFSHNCAYVHSLDVFLTVHHELTTY